MELFGKPVEIVPLSYFGVPDNHDGPLIQVGRLGEIRRANMICFYHSADLDGHCSGAIVKYAFPDCEMIGIDYGQPFPWDKIEALRSGYEVWMVDFSLQPWEDMVRLDKCACRVTWIDHHKSAIEEHAGFDYPLFAEWVLDSNYAACELTWNYIASHHLLAGRGTERVQGKPMPEAVHLLGRYDIWKHEETPGALEFQYGMRIHETRPGSNIWSELFSEQKSGKACALIRNTGRDLLAYERTQSEKFMAAYGFEVEFDGLRCIAANRGMSNSLLFDSVYDPEKHDAMLMFAWKGGQWTVSLYSTKPDVDVSVICKARGGGGHKGAAGFQCAELPFLGASK